MEGFRKKLIFLLIISLSLFLVSGLLLLFSIRDINKKVKEANNYQQELTRQGAILDRIQSLERETQKANLYLDSLNNALPNETEVIALESKLKNLASLYNLNNLSFRFGTLNSPQDNEPKSYSFNLIVDGQVDALLNWLDAFQKLPYSFHLEQIEITQTSPLSSQTVAAYNIKILGRIYLR
jgi:Tfp pilus assembly protein PilO